VAGEYASGEYRYWHLSVPSPELTVAIEDGWFPTRGRVLDLGCGAGTEVGFLAGLGARSVGIDLSVDALTIASAEHGSGRFVQADVTELPFTAGSFDAALDRGCLHYLPRDARARYATEVARVLRPGGRFLLRACLRAAGIRNDLDEGVLRSVFVGWRVRSIVSHEITTDDRMMQAIVARLEHV
jgi:SAM-dependent methyltransferase